MTASLLLVAALVGGPSAAAAPAPRWVAPLALPLNVTRAFDPPEERWSAGHRGIDLTAAAGATVVAAGGGRISFAGTLAGRGVLVVSHGALRTTYEPVHATVSVGSLVRAGEPIGFLRAGHLPGSPSAGVLHWGLRRGETYLDPLSLLSAARPVRLLPHWGEVSIVPHGPGPDPAALEIARADVTRADAAATPGPGPPSDATLASVRSRLPSAPDNRGSPFGGGLLAVSALAATAALLTRRPP